MGLGTSLQVAGPGRAGCGWRIGKTAVRVRVRGRGKLVTSSAWPTGACSLATWAAAAGGQWGAFRWIPAERSRVWKERAEAGKESASNKSSRATHPILLGYSRPLHTKVWIPRVSSQPLSPGTGRQRAGPCPESSAWPRGQIPHMASSRTNTEREFKSSKGSGAPWKE